MNKILRLRHRDTNTMIGIKGVISPASDFELMAGRDLAYMGEVVRDGAGPVAAHGCRPSVGVKISEGKIGLITGLDQDDSIGPDSEPPSADFLKKTGLIAGKLTVSVIEYYKIVSRRSGFDKGGRL